MQIKKLDPTSFTPRMGAYSHGIQVSLLGADLIFVTGQIALDKEGNVISGSVEDQAEFVFQNIRTILAEAGADMSMVVKAQIFLTDISDFSKISPIRNKYFGASEPASTLVEVSSLVKEGCRIEVEVIAVKQS